MDFKNSKTYQNIKTALEGELRATSKYQIYAIKAREDGFEQIADIFDETSRNEQEHAEIWMKWTYPDKEIPPTVNNLADAIAGESYEYHTMYLDFAKTAKQEGYPELCRLFSQIGHIEHQHQMRYEKLHKNIKTNQVFCKPCKSVWICMVCGHVTYEKCSPKICPVCKNPQSFTEIKADNY